MKLITIAVLAIAISTGCNKKGAYGSYEEALKNGLQMKYVQQFDDFFDGAEHSIMYYSGSKGDPVWNSSATLDKRYLITMQMDISFDSTRSWPIPKHEPNFLIQEIENQEILSDGRTVTIYTDNQLEFGLNEWRYLLQSGGDFNAIG